MMANENTTKILAVYAVNYSREIRDVIKSYLFFDKRTIHYAEYLKSKRTDLLYSIIGSRYDPDDPDDPDEEDEEDLGSYMFWTDSHEYNNRYKSTLLPTRLDPSLEHQESFEEDESEPKFNALFCITCGNYIGSNTIRLCRYEDIATFSDLSMMDVFRKKKYWNAVSCYCD